MSQHEDKLWRRYRERYTTTVSVLGRGGIVPAKEIAAQTGTSVRTVYRFIHHLNDVGYRVKGGAGAGYLLISKQEGAIYG